jgi:glycosyltransferase involved in cell wall biosynthesis
VADVVWKYPCNLSVLQRAQGVIVHSEYSRHLANRWYGISEAEHWAVVPSLRPPVFEVDRVNARQALSLETEDLVVCSFGLLGPHKLNHRLLDAWLESELANSNESILVFVGENHSGEYGDQLLERIRDSGLSDRIRITGWTDTNTFNKYLAAADIGVQLRTLSRGETSRAVLDCMSRGLPTIINAHGSLTELPDYSVWKLPDEFSDAEMVHALETIWHDTKRRRELGLRAREVIAMQHSPRACAAQFAEAIEHFHDQAQSGPYALIRSIAAVEGHLPTEGECLALSKTIAQSIPLAHPARQLMLDVSATMRSDLKSGIERVARALVMSLIERPPAGYRIEPVYLSDNGGIWHHRYARHFSLSLLGCPPDALINDVVEPQNCDLLLDLDLSGQMLIEAEKTGLISHYRNVGVAVYSMVYDLLPILLPEFFPTGTDTTHAAWLKTIAHFDGAVCISKAVADEFNEWLIGKSHIGESPFRIGWFHLGADIERSAPTRGLPDDAKQMLTQLTAYPSFLMVGTIEPRKGYLQALEAFSALWKQGLEVNLVIVGKEGWIDVPHNMRRTIPETVEQLRNHPERGERMFWLEGISDEYLEKIYAASTCLLASSEGEGFGLPLIEAAQHKLPIIARDIPVFREVAGEYAYYFHGSSTTDLTHALTDWLKLNEVGKAPSSQGIQLSTWAESSEVLTAMLLDSSHPNWLKTWSQE